MWVRDSTIMEVHLPADYGAFIEGRRACEKTKRVKQEAMGLNLENNKNVDFIVKSLEAIPVLGRSDVIRLRF